MAGNQRQGVAYIRVNGMELESMEGASFTPSGTTREEVTGSRVYGWKGKPR
ncbi:phage tail protein, partial [Shigella flexneri]|nr:phage tail protein [Shigella flexneri]